VVGTRDCHKSVAFRRIAPTDKGNKGLKARSFLPYDEQGQGKGQGKDLSEFSLGTVVLID